MLTNLYNKAESLRAYLANKGRLAIAFSGGVDSSYLLLAAKEAQVDFRAYYVKSQFQPQFELDDAVNVAEYSGVSDRVRVISFDVLADRTVCSNPPDRCYYCKRRIMGAITSAARCDGYELTADGTNASDDAEERPGMKALREYGIVSPLQECGLHKDEIRLLLREAGSDVWDKPAYACLATRIRTGEIITAEKLQTTEKAESILYDMGFRDFRVRMRNGDALVQVTGMQLKEAFGREPEIRALLQDMYGSVTIDSKPRN